MADFCKACSERIFGEDFGDLKGLCKDDEMVQVICEGCGYIFVNSEGIKVKELDK